MKFPISCVVLLILAAQFSGAAEGDPRLAEANALIENAATYDRAVEIYREILADDPAAEYPPDLALAEAARIRHEQGDAAAATEIWRELVERFPDTFGAQEARRRLEAPES